MKHMKQNKMLGFSHHHVFPHLPPPEIPSGNQTWQWKIPYKCRLKAGNTTTKKTWGFLKINFKWWFFFHCRCWFPKGILPRFGDWSPLWWRGLFWDLDTRTFRGVECGSLQEHLGTSEAGGFFQVFFFGSKNGRFWPTTKKSFGHVWWILMLDGPVV